MRLPLAAKLVRFTSGTSTTSVTVTSSSIWWESSTWRSSSISGRTGVVLDAVALSRQVGAVHERNLHHISYRYQLKHLVGELDLAILVDLRPNRCSSGCGCP